MFPMGVYPFRLVQKKVLVGFVNRKENFVCFAWYMKCPVPEMWDRQACNGFADPITNSSSNRLGIFHQRIVSDVLAQSERFSLGGLAQTKQSPGIHGGLDQNTLKEV